MICIVENISVNYRELVMILGISDSENLRAARAIRRHPLEPPSMGIRISCSISMETVINLIISKTVHDEFQNSPQAGSGSLNSNQIKAQWLWFRIPGGPLWSHHFCLHKKSRRQTESSCGQNSGRKLGTEPGLWLGKSQSGRTLFP